MNKNEAFQPKQNNRESNMVFMYLKDISWLHYWEKILVIVIVF